MKTVNAIRSFVTFSPAWSNAFMAFEVREDGKVWSSMVFCSSAWFNYSRSKKYGYKEFVLPAEDTWSRFCSQPTNFKSIEDACMHNELGDGNVMIQYG